MTNPESLEALCLDIAVRAGALAASFRDGLAPGHAESVDLDQAAKSSPTDVVSAADLAAEDFIVSAITEARPDDGIVGEEGASRPSNSGLTWVIDPVDGTTNFVFGRAEWAVSVAVVDHFSPNDPLTHPAIAGAVAVPALGEAFSAGRGGGAHLHTAGVSTPLTLTSSVDVARSLVATGFSYDAVHRERQARRVAALMPHIRDIRRSGSAAIDLCHVACGRADAYTEDALNHWDVAAGALICLEAGAEVISPRRDDVRPLSIMATRPGLAAPLRALIESSEHD